MSRDEVEGRFQAIETLMVTAERSRVEMEEQILERLEEAEDRAIELSRQVERNSRLLAAFNRQIVVLFLLLAALGCSFGLLFWADTAGEEKLLSGLALLFGSAAVGLATGKLDMITNALQK